MSCSSLPPRIRTVTTPDGSGSRGVGSFGATRYSTSPRPSSRIGESRASHLTVGMGDVPPIDLGHHGVHDGVPQRGHRYGRRWGRTPHTVPGPVARRLVEGGLVAQWPEAVPSREKPKLRVLDESAGDVSPRPA